MGRSSIPLTQEPSPQIETRASHKNNVNCILPLSQRVFSKLIASFPVRVLVNLGAGFGEVDGRHLFSCLVFFLGVPKSRPHFAHTVDVRDS